MLLDWCSNAGPKRSHKAGSTAKTNLEIIGKLTTVQIVFKSYLINKYPGYCSNWVKVTQLQLLVTFLVIFLVTDCIFKNVLQGVISYFWS